MIKHELNDKKRQKKKESTEKLLDYKILNDIAFLGCATLSDCFNFDS